MPTTGTFYVSPHEGAAREAYEDRSKQDAIAQLSCVEVDAMSRVELIDVVRESRALMLRPDTEQRLDVLDQPTLRKLVYIIRYSFQQHGHGAPAIVRLGRRDSRWHFTGRRGAENNDRWSAAIKNP